MQTTGIFVKEKRQSILVCDIKILLLFEFNIDLSYRNTFFRAYVR